jgi:transcriptional regulator with XRE-family HTH domain
MLLYYKADFQFCQGVLHMSLDSGILRSMKSKPESFARWLGHQMLKRNLTGRQLAIGLGMSAPAVNHWVSGSAVPADRAVAKIADYFKVDKLFLMRLLGRIEGLSESQLTDDEVDALRAYRDLDIPGRARARTILAVLRDEPED